LPVYRLFLASAVAGFRLQIAAPLFDGPGIQLNRNFHCYAYKKSSDYARLKSFA